LVLAASKNKFPKYFNLHFSSSDGKINLKYYDEREDKYPSYAEEIAASCIDGWIVTVRSMSEQRCGDGSCSSDVVDIIKIGKTVDGDMVVYADNSAKIGMFIKENYYRYAWYKFQKEVRDR
jgi:hypothetical protein